MKRRKGSELAFLLFFKETSGPPPNFLGFNWGHSVLQVIDERTFPPSCYHTHNKILCVCKRRERKRLFRKSSTHLPPAVRFEFNWILFHKQQELNRMKKKCNVLQADFSITGIRPQNIYIYSRLKSTYVLDKEVRQSTLVSLSLRSSCYPVAASFFCVSEGLLTLYSRKSETGNIRMTIPVFLLVATATTSVFVVVVKKRGNPFYRYIYSSPMLFR